MRRASCVEDVPWGTQVLWGPTPSSAVPVSCRGRGGMWVVGVHAVSPWDIPRVALVTERISSALILLVTEEPWTGTPLCLGVPFYRRAPTSWGRNEDEAPRLPSP